ncbi:MAG: hypothetical protein CMC48_08170 [Flavobacteriaceae bacterium]|nr:hypothetical protein [Flavobacteriaceae bacterium]|tara:strand:- start:1156 stop:2877 length:1722 start_codon:yes stop_codon:yes gene_type:complete
MKKFAPFVFVFTFLFIGCESKIDKSFIGVSYTQDLAIEDGFDGRLLLMFSKKLKPEPRFQINDGKNTGIIVGVDVENWKPGEIIKFNSNLLAYPINQLKDLPNGDYYVQAFLHKYETFKMATGFELKLPMDQGEGQKWNISPENLYSNPQKVNIQKNNFVEIKLNNEIPKIEPIEDSNYIKHIKIQSKLLSEFWGRPMFLQANVLLPKGFKKTGSKRYPLMVFHGHFPNTFRGFRNKPPDAPKKDSIFNERFGITGYKFIQENEAYNFYKQWISKSFPRFMVIEIQHQNPYYDDSYAVNSANLGPYGDAITYELIPYIENMFDGIGEGWGRFLYGGSTGGWEALAAQVFYPKEYNGCFAACPDPIDFRAFTIVDLYKDKNAYYDEGEFMRNLRPGIRDGIGRIKAYLKDINRREYVLGSNGRSGDQWDIWQAVYSPVGENGYPKPIWDKLSGEIDKEVANYWKENYDLRYIMERDWSEIGKDLKGKINIYCGDMDNYYLNNAVVLTEKFLEKTSNPYYNGEVDYGNGAEHCWNGDQENPNHISRLRYNTMYLNKIKKRLKLTAPKDNKLINWD